jgi:hypothetical protein
MRRRHGAVLTWLPAAWAVFPCAANVVAIIAEVAAVCCVATRCRRRPVEQAPQSGQDSVEPHGEQSSA